MGDTTRAWLVLGTFVQMLFTMAAALTAWRSGQASISPARGEVAWTDATTFVALGLMSASMGLQAIMGKRMNTEYATTGAFKLFDYLRPVSPLPSIFYHHASLYLPFGTISSLRSEHDSR